MQLEDYTTGTVSVSNGSSSVTGTGTAWSTADFKAGDTFHAQGLVGIIASVDSDTSITLRDVWAGTSISGGAYLLRYQPDNSRMQGTTRQMLDELRQGIWLTPDATGKTADKSTYDDKAAGFRFLDVSVDPFKLYVKESDTSGDWSAGADWVGPKGDAGSSDVVGTSTTSLAIATGSKTFTIVETNRGWGAGARLRASSDANGANFMEGVVTSYSGTGLTIGVDKIGGSGTFADWTINLAGIPGSGDVSSTDTDASTFGFVLDEDDMASDSATKVPTQQSVKAYVDTGTVYKLADRTAMKALDGSKHLAVYLMETGRDGTFQWNSSDLSAEVTVDTQEGVYVAPTSDTTGASGAWVRQFDGPEDLRWYGLKAGVGNAAGNTLALTAAFASGREVYLPAGNYLIDPVVFSSFASLNIRGAGRDVTKITLNSTGTALTFSNCQWLQISDISFQASGSAQSLANAIGVQLDTSSCNAVIERCNFYGFSLDGLRLVGTSGTTLSGNVVRQCYFLGCGRNQLYGIYNNDYTIDGNQFGKLGTATHASFGCYLENCSQGDYTQNKHWNNVVAFKALTCSANRYLGNRFEESDHEGVWLESDDHSVFEGNVVHTNSQTSNGTYDNVYLKTVTKFLFVGNQVYSWNALYSRWGVNFDAGCDEITIKGNQVKGYDTANFGPYRFDGSVTRVDGDLIINLTATGVAAASTIYMSSGAETAEGAAYRAIHRRYAVGRISIGTTVSPGTSQTFTYTLRKNGADTVQTASSTGSAFSAASNVISPQVLFDQGDFMSMKLVTSATAAVASHRAYIVLVGY